MKKIVVKLYGGLGNQLFCYAMARRMAIVNNCDLVIDAHTGFKEDIFYKRSFQLSNFRCSNEFLIMGVFLRWIIALKIKAVRFFRKFSPYVFPNFIIQTTYAFDPLILEYSPQKKYTYVDGYWQSEKYFNDIREILLGDLLLSRPVSVHYQKLAKEISSKNSVAIHFRDFDAPEFDGVYPQGIGYYEVALKKISDLVTDPIFYIFSDNHGKARIIFSHLKQYNMNYIETKDCQNSAIIDLWLMSKCNNFIISNSTFSWWGAWLSTAIQKVVISPKLVGDTTRTEAWGFQGLLPESWITL